MDIKQLTYFIAIVERKCNLSAAAKDLNISQPALSKSILQFEDIEGVSLFSRKSGRLTGLTPLGENFHKKALKLVEAYNVMMDELRSEKLQYIGNLKIGMPSLLLTILFSEVLPRIVVDNPLVQFEIIERKATELKKSFINEEIDIVALLAPTDFSHKLVEQKVIKKSPFAAFMDKENPLAKEKSLAWSQFADQTFILADKSFMTYKLIKKKFREERIAPHVALHATAWDFMVLATTHTPLITILPVDVGEVLMTKDIVMVPMEDPIYWEVVLCRGIAEETDDVNDFVFNELLDYFDERNNPASKDVVHTTKKYQN